MRQSYDDQSLEQNLCHLQGEEWMHPPDDAENEYAGAGCHRDVSSEEQLVIQCHNQVPCSLGWVYHRVLEINREVMEGGCLL